MKTPDGGELGSAANTVRAVAQQRRQRSVVADRDEATVADAKAEVRPVLGGPSLDAAVHAAAVDLQQVAEDGKAARPRQVGQGPSRDGAGRRFGGGRFHHWRLLKDRRIVSGSGAIVNDSRSSGSPPAAVVSVSMS